VFALVKETVRQFYSDKVPRLAAALAYHTLFAVAPMALIAVAVAGAFYGEAAARGELADRVAEAVGPASAGLIQDVVASISSQGNPGVLATIAAGAIIIWGSARAFLQMQGALNAVWGVQLRRSTSLPHVIASRLLPFAMVLGTGFLLIASLFLGTLLSGVRDMELHVFGWSVHTLSLVEPLVWLVVGTFLFAVVFKILPDVLVDWRDAWTGGAVTSALFGIGRFVVSLYLGQSSVSSAYGAAGSIVVLLLWVYFSAQIVLLGAEFTQVHAHRSGRPILPRSYAVMIRKVVHDPGDDRLDV